MMARHAEPPDREADRGWKRLALGLVAPHIGAHGRKGQRKSGAMVGADGCHRLPVLGTGAERFGADALRAATTLYCSTTVTR